MGKIGAFFSKMYWPAYRAGHKAGSKHSTDIVAHLVREWDKQRIETSRLQKAIARKNRQIKKLQDSQK